ncbi:MAG TPA: beta-propeller fold lactonase family protein [Acidimicrobiales bacterium]|nr:beta-propeller fold lactonase family protein [Acidimicrobiales bacterium]
MALFRRALALAAVVAAPVAGAALPAGAAGPSPGAVYLLSNQVAGNSVLAYSRAADGTLTPAGSVATGGTGTGGGLGSQGAVVLDEDGTHLYAVNAGSNTVTSFRVADGGLERLDVVPSGGTMPTSLTVHGGLLYVLDAGGPGAISGFTVDDGHLAPLAGSTRPLSGTATAPAQVSFTPDGTRLLVTERATQRIDVYTVGAGGLATGPNVAPSAGPTPFGFGFDNKGHAIVSEAFGGAADASAVSSYAVTGGGLETVSASVPTTETAACWIAVTNNGKFAYAGNAGTNSVTGYRVAPDGSLAVLDADGKTASAAAGVTDLALSRNSRFLYGRLSNRTVGVWAVAADGSLADLGPVPGLPAGAAGIAAA